MKDPPPKIAFPDFRSGLVLGLSTFKQNSLLVPRLRRAGSEKRLLFVDSLAESGFASRGATTFDIFWRGVSPVETEPGESCELGRRISRSAVFDNVYLGVHVNVQTA